jgi:chemotaxis protein MotB
MAVLRRLQALGVKPDRMAAEGYGQYAPFGDNSTAEGRTENRKVVIAVSKLSAKGSGSSSDAAADVSVLPQVAESAGGLQSPASSQAEPAEISADGTIKVIRLPHGGIKITSAADSPPPAQQKRDN